MSLLVEVAGCPGYVLCGEIAETFCFVPLEYVTATADGSLELAELDYVRSGWSERNMRCNDATGGKHLFPRAEDPMADPAEHSVRMFVDRLHHLCRGAA